MTLILFLGSYIDLLVKWWKVNLGLAITWFFGLFGEPVMGSIDPDIAAGFKEIVVGLATLFTAAVTIYIAWRKGRRELSKIEQESQHEKREHRLKVLTELKESGLSAGREKKVDELIDILIEDLSK